MMKKRNEKIIIVDLCDYDSLIESVAKMQGVRIKKTRKHIKIYVTEWRDKFTLLQKNKFKIKRSIMVNDLMAISPENNMVNIERSGRQFSAIISK